ncbi:MAG: histidine kinase, partial [Ilumatobacter sp.]|uniref:sensor histidine kinase n=1 Tax=Ilumatobacter sp. TaxID=1967498 RepID=UPI003C75EAA0
MTMHDAGGAPGASRQQSPRPIEWIRAHPVVADAMFGALLTAITLAFHLFDSEIEDGHARLAWWTVPLVLLAVAPIAWRRIRPIAVTLIVTFAQVVASFADVFGPEFLGVTIALYSLGAHATGRRRTQTVITVVALTSTLFFAGLLVEELTVGLLLSSTILLITAFVLGDNLGRRREAADALQERLDRAERERELMARERVNAERARIARELHDVVAHSVSAMVIQAGAARRSLGHSPESALTALGNIERAGRDAMNELRGVLGVLRRSETEGIGDADRGRPAATPQPTLADVAQLVAGASDLPIVASIESEWDDLASGTDLAGFRVVQEALTNVRRHAGPVTTIDLNVRRGRSDITIEISDDGRGAAADDAGSGYGILGMRERVEAVGGRLTAGS